MTTFSSTANEIGRPAAPRRRLIMAAAGAGSLLAVVAGGLMLSRGRPPGPGQPAGSPSARASGAPGPVRPAPSIAPIAPPSPTAVGPIPTGRAQLFVVVTPKDARVLVDGMLKAEATPFVIALPPGRASVRIEREGYLPLAELVDLRGGRQLLFDRTLRPAPEAVPVEGKAEGAGKVAAADRKKKIAPARTGRQDPHVVPAKGKGFVKIKL